jgi:hypothetical protein
MPTSLKRLAAFRFAEREVFGALREGAPSRQAQAVPLPMSCLTVAPTHLGPSVVGCACGVACNACGRRSALL